MTDAEAHAYAMILRSSGYKLSKSEYYRMRRWFTEIYEISSAEFSIEWLARHSRQWWEVALINEEEHAFRIVVWINSESEYYYYTSYLKQAHDDLKRALLISFGHAVAKTRRKS